MSQTTDDAQSVDAALQQFRDMIGADGFQLAWEPVDEANLVVRITATDEACADCLVPQPLVEQIVADALTPTPYSLARVDMPAEH